MTDQDHNVFIERVLAIDPGKTTGQAVLERRRGLDGSEHRVRLLDSVETKDGDTIDYVRSVYGQYGPPPNEHSPRLRIVVESFLITARTTAKSQEVSHALRTIGAVEQACRDLGYPLAAIAWQRPDQKKAFPNPRLKTLGFWHRGGGGHALDGIRHGLIYLTGTGIMAELNEQNILPESL